MATIVNTPSAPANESSGMGYLFGAVLLVIVAIIFAYMFVPALRGGGGSAAPSNPVEQAPAGGGDSSTNIQVPDKIDVNLNQGENPGQ